MHMPMPHISHQITNCPCWRHTAWMFLPSNYNLSTNQSCLLIPNESYALLNGTAATATLCIIPLHLESRSRVPQRMQTAVHSVFFSFHLPFTCVIHKYRLFKLGLITSQRDIML